MTCSASSINIHQRRVWEQVETLWSWLRWPGWGSTCKFVTSSNPSSNSHFFYLTEIIESVTVALLSNPNSPHGILSPQRFIGLIDFNVGKVNLVMIWSLWLVKRYSCTDETPTKAVSGLEVGESWGGFADAYTTSSSYERHAIAIMVCLAGFFSQISAFIFFPAIPYISRDLGVSVEAINLTITGFLVIQAIIPSVLGDLADQVGRRPTYLLALTT